MSRIVKVVLAGESGSGKSSLLSRYLDNGHNMSYSPTVGIDIGIKSIDDQNVKLHIWDTAGQERFRSVSISYFRNAETVMLCFDMTSQISFDSLESWTLYISDNSQVIVVGCKADLPIVVNMDHVHNWCRTQGYLYAETSALTGRGIEDLFSMISIPEDEVENPSLNTRSALLCRCQ